MAPPLYVKGGVWTNVEDEILKAAVQKYGLYQWERISSLLPKKSAKQVKARWVEYLSPIINKADWTPEEDEKLLNLHKVFPNQWRSIASAMNRTAVQCVERYQKLIDEVTGYQPKDDEENLGLSGPGIETLPAVGASSTPIVAGDINFNPESKPAMPDDEELPDDEREMVAEAKARLGNIQGKKAKRKARERMLEESKRIALLQKRRELKAAGINIKLTTKNKKKRKEFDYTADIYQEIKPKTGPYDVSEEMRENDLAQNRFNKEVSTKVISMKDIDDRIAKEEAKRRKEKEKKLTRNKRVIEADEELVNREGDDIKRRKLELPKIPNKNRTEIAKLTKSVFESLPPPKHKTGKVLPSFANDATQDLKDPSYLTEVEAELESEDDNLSLTKKLDPKLYTKVNKEIDMELAKLDTTLSRASQDYQLPKTYEVAESIVHMLHTLHKRNEVLSSQLRALTEFENQKDQKLEILNGLIDELAQVNVELETEKKKAEGIVFI